MRLFSHTCSNTEIVCALDCAELLIGIDTDSDHPPHIVGALPKLGRDLDLDVAGVIALRPDLVLTSLTVPGHERIVAELESAGLRTITCDPLSLEDIYGDIRRIAQALDVAERGERLVTQMRAAMPKISLPRPPKVLVEWWPKPVIAPARQSWATDLIELAGGSNPWGALDAKSAPLTDAQIIEAAPDAVVMSWCGVKEENYRAEVVRRRPGWADVPALRHDRIVPITEAWLGRPGPRLVEGYRALRRVIDSVAGTSSV
jgi:iron complex transport system substrate-binding protein